MKRQVLGLVVLAAFAGLVTTARADDKPNPTGTWKWTVTMGNNTRDVSLTLKLEGDKLTGTLVRGDQETPIEDAKYKDGELSFKVTRERDGQKFTIKYNGKITGDTIKGKSEFGAEGNTQSRDWEAKRAK